MPQVLFVAEAAGATLEHADLVVQPSTKPSATLFFGWQYAAMPSQCRSIIATNFS